VEHTLEIENTTDKPLKATLFGAKKNLKKANFGNPEGLVITNKGKDKYEDVMNSCKDSDMWIHGLTVESDNSEQVVEIIEMGADGSFIPIIMRSYSHEESPNRIHVTSRNLHPVGAVGYLSFLVHPKTKLTLNAY